MATTLIVYHYVLLSVANTRMSPHETATTNLARMRSDLVEEKPHLVVENPDSRYSLRRYLEPLKRTIWHGCWELGRRPQHSFAS